jgi:hypothetical protein
MSRGLPGSVGCTGECSLGSCYYYGASVGVGVEFAEGIVEFEEEGRAEGVEGFGPIQRYLMGGDQLERLKGNAGRQWNYLGRHQALEQKP